MASLTQSWQTGSKMEPLQAKALARTAFAVWRQHHDWQKRKWRDALRAKVHFRLTRTRSVLQGLKDLGTKATKLKRADVRIIANHIVCLQHRALRGFILNVIQRRRLLRMLKEADRFHSYSARRRGLLGWFQFIEIKAWEANHTRKAVMFWCSKMISRGWSWLKEGIAEARFSEALKSQSYSLLR